MPLNCDRCSYCAADVVRMKKLTKQDFANAARMLRTGVAEIKTVCQVESRGGGFQKDGRPVILFERHIFHRHTNGRFDKKYPALSNPEAGGYGPSSQQWAKFEAAAKLDQKAAMLSISMGLFQIMGFNFQAAGYVSVEAYFKAMHISEGEQLLAFCRFLKASSLDDELRDHQWRAFARGYNGPAYRKNQYDTKLAEAYQRFAEEDNSPLISELPRIHNTPQIDYASDASVAIPSPPTGKLSEKPKDEVQLVEEIQTKITDAGEAVTSTVSTLTSVVGKSRDSVKAFRTLVSMSSFGVLIASIGAWFKDNPLLATLIFVGILIVVGFAWKYMSRQEKIAVERTRKQ